MAKKGSLRLIYFIGMVLVLVGFIIPMFKFSFGPISGTRNGFTFIDFKHFGFVTIGSLLIFIGACLAVLFSLVPVSSSEMLKLICLIVSIVGGIIIIVGFNQDSFYKFVGKQFFKCAYIGFYMILCGWVVALVGWITKK